MTRTRAPRLPKFVSRAFAAALAMGFMVALGAGCSKKTSNGGGQSQQISKPQLSGKTYTVQKRDFLKKIAAQENVAWESLLLVNEGFLQTHYEDACKNYSTRFRNNPHRRGTFCNDRFNRPYGNTLLPGWVLQIPVAVAPPEIEKTVTEIKGNNVAIVIDDTGSMLDDRQAVSAWYMAALRKYGKSITGVYLYADGKVRKYEPNGNVEFKAMGEKENTHQALEEAADDKPDAIILVTDEPGDDWDVGDLDELPPVYAHCIDRNYSCRGTLTRLAKETKGKYVEGM